MRSPHSPTVRNISIHSSSLGTSHDLGSRYSHPVFRRNGSSSGRPALVFQGNHPDRDPVDWSILKGCREECAEFLSFGVFRRKIFLEEGKSRPFLHFPFPCAQPRALLQGCILDSSVEEAQHRGDRKRSVRVASLEHDPGRG